ncbi:MAG TPA: SpoIIE family protein phosphatase [Candidatus Omnitrophota bacterium]|nr:SpoIIE family protein phosphatase [Candidatus Omnitrophota bacterium]HPS36398.1 SpoIIE family protein phosphatase [Candidatus Omnitrophota bacterium]
MTPNEEMPSREKDCPADKILNLQKVLALNSILNSTLDLNALLKIIMETSAEVMNAKVASLMLIDEAADELVFRVALGDKGAELEEKFRIQVGEGIAGTVAKTGEPLVINDPQNDPRFAKRFDNSTGFRTEAILCVPLKVRGRVTGVLQAINPLKKKGFCTSDLDLFATFAHQAAIAIENAKLHTEIVKQEKAKQALKIAHEIQQNFLPDLKNRSYGVDVFAQSLPALDVGGDLYDVSVLDNDRVSIILGDVSGKGVPAALYMVRAMSEYRFLAPLAKDPGELLTRLNRKLAEGSMFGMFLTLVCLFVDKNTRTIQYASAGHPPILLRNAQTSQTEFLKGAQSVPLGMVPETSFYLNSVQVGKGAALFLYTDGVSEARSKNGKEYGVERLKACVKAPAASAREYSERIFEDVRQFAAGAEPHDDVTTLTLVIP